MSELERMVDASRPCLAPRKPKMLTRSGKLLVKIVSPQLGANFDRFFFGEGSPTEIRDRKGYPYSNLSTGGTSRCHLKMGWVKPL